ncbi:MAG: hypothetical protein HC836_12675 [Richelia sp. RM2_1_2]|nr:hypothetical protein [Richelia sp. RM2_1_2]
MSHFCKICQAVYEKRGGLHLHLKTKHKLNQELYYHTYFPRYDLYDNKLIIYKNYQQYFETYFNTRENFLNYSLENNKKEVEEIFKKVIENRIKRKKIKNALSFVEAKTCLYPTPYICDLLDINYNELSKSLGLKVKFNYKYKKFDTDNQPLSILIDNREKKPFKFDCPTIVSKLDFGDYTTNSHYKKIYVERKSFSDLVTTLSTNYNRFCKEIERANKFKSYLIICVESPLSSFQDESFWKYYKSIEPDFILNRLRNICQIYSNCQFVFVDTVSGAAKLVKQIFLEKKNIKRMDLQYIYTLQKVNNRYPKGLTTVAR